MHIRCLVSPGTQVCLKLLPRTRSVQTEASERILRTNSPSCSADPKDLKLPVKQPRKEADPDYYSSESSFVRSVYICARMYWIICHG